MELAVPPLLRVLGGIVSHILRVNRAAHAQVVEMALAANKTPTEIAEQAISEMHARWEATMKIQANYTMMREAQKQ